MSDSILMEGPDNSKSERYSGKEELTINYKHSIFALIESIVSL